MRERKRYLIIILGILLISTLGTFAWLTWKSVDTSLVLTIGDIEGTIVTLKPYMVEETLIPTLTYESNEFINITAKNNGTTENDIVLYYKINDIDEELITDSFKYTILKSIDNGTTYEEYQTGNFASSILGEEYVILMETVPANTTYNYKVYTWLDGENETSSNIQGKSFKAELRANIYNGSVVTVDVPDGLIPVTIANDGTVTSILETDSTWYNYNNKEWANAVLVTESSRSTYLNTTGVTIPEDDILAYYVYVPRYKYKIWTTGTSSVGEEQEIEILFENKYIPKSQGTKVGEYRTHPGFTFGDEELNGIWVGKFEPTGTGDLPTVKPNMSPLNSQTIATQFQSSIKFAGGVLLDGTTSFFGSDTYGLNSTANSHAAKNTEWGAVAYLSHSRYGINEEIRINNYRTSDYMLKTGCGAASADAAESTTCDITYGESSSYPQSTTGNISGIFDMSGGAWERVMGIFANSEGTLYTGNSATTNSGFNGLLGGNSTLNTSGIDFPENKYYDIYRAYSGITIDPLTACNGGYCYGHALSEVSGWYADRSNFIFSTNPWLYRGGNATSNTISGIFAFNYYYGVVSIHDTFRSVITYSKEKGNKIIVDVPNGLIPVTLSDNGTVTTISKTDNNWYNYNQKEWANGVLVTESSRSTYLNTTGVTIPEDDILAYYVYVPRYKYKIWTTGTSSVGEEQEIEILFENKYIPKSQGTKVGEYRTHPGFTFGDEELNGIWVGKFETTGTADNPTIKPNEKPLSYQTISKEFISSLKFSGGILSNGTTTFSGSSTYGLGSEVNSHMAKNTEWSAAAYLSHSKYGINTEVRINNYGNSNSQPLGTGCGASTTAAAESETCAIFYGSATSYPQSTTGNITGIFDMSGGAWERVMGVFANSSGMLWSGNNKTENSGFNGMLGTSGTSYTSGVAFPESKYYDVYKASSGITISALTACNSGYCYGHGLSEVSGWYGGYTEFVSSTAPWFTRGGNSSYGSSVFSFSDSSSGDTFSSNGFRAVLVIE